MIQVIRALVYMMLAIAAYMSSNLGFSWIEEGHGLHPAIAFSVATSCVWAIIIRMVADYKEYIAIQEEFCVPER